MKIFLLPLLLLTFEYSSAQTTVGGTISNNTTWYPSGNPYIVIDTIIINENVTLTIKPGVIVKFEKGVLGRYCIIVNGIFRAIGTEDSMITFTSNEFIPNYNDWGKFIFSDLAQDYDFSNQTGCILQYCNIEYAGTYFDLFGNVMIIMYGTSAYIDHCIITKVANTAAIYALGCESEIRITNNKFISMIGGGGASPDMIYLLANSSVDISCNLFYDNEGYPAYSEEYLNFHHNLVVNHTETGFDIAPLTSFHHNTFIDNRTDFNLITVRGSLDHNTVTRNIFPDLFGGEISIYVADTNATINNNNIYGQLLKANPFYEIGTYLQRQSYYTIPIDAMNNWFKENSESEIDQVIHDYKDDTTYYLINYEPFLSSPDTDAPITPPTGVTKTDLGGNNVLVTWNPNPDADVAGYKIYWGDPTGYSFSNSIDVGNVTSYTLTNFFFNDTVAVTAYDADAGGGPQDQCEGHESWFTSDYQFTGISSAAPPLNHLHCFPNPADQYTILDVDDQGNQNAQLVIRSSIGEIMKVVKLDSHPRPTIQLSDLPSGIYQVFLFSENRETGFIKLAIVR